MSRHVKRSGLAVGLAVGLGLAAAGSALADAPRAVGLSAPGTRVADHAAGPYRPLRVRRHAYHPGPVHRRAWTPRTVVADAGLAAFYGPRREFGLLILGIGY